MNKFDKYSILEFLQSNVGKVTFIKADGSTREMICTTDSRVVPATKRTGKAESVHNDELVTVYEVDKQQWRSFYADTVMSVELVR